MWHDIFDTIYVVSLESELARRTYVSDHLASVGLSDFVWHDACGPDHEDVAKLYDTGRVMSFPPCFRCGKASCGKDDCNNVLIPAQVAVFATYLRLWRRIAERPQRCLIVEDDVRIHDHWPLVLKYLADRISRGKLTFEASQPHLLRLGWALGKDHQASKKAYVSDKIKMSNPCHAMTSAFAQLALERFKGVNHTADVYLHREVPRRGEATTVFPPIASELSWSVGTFPSLIHPKEIHAEYLEKTGRHAEAEQFRDLSRKHATSIAHKR